MSFLITITIDDPSPEDCPTTLAEERELLRNAISGELVGDFIPYVTGAATPDVDDQDKVWHRVDANGRPIGTYVFYSGSWRRQYTVPVGTVAMYSGDPGVDFSGADGAGTVGGEFDGWQLCNGLNGAANLSDKFVVGAKMDDLAIGYPEGNGPWKTSVTGETLQSGGVKDITSTVDNTYRRAFDAIQMSLWEADGNTPNVAGDLWGLGAGHTLLSADAGNLTPTAILTVPPFFALAFIQFKGYA